jgi:cytochrome c5
MTRAAHWAGLALWSFLVGCSEKPQSAAAVKSDSAAGMSQHDQRLLAAAKVALPPPGIAAGDLPDPTSNGAQLVAKYCAQCHDLPSPTMHSAVDWPSITRRMWLRMERLGDLGVQNPTAAERYTMIGYLTANALKVSGANLPPGKGRDQFAVTCSRCHALPDPKSHSPQDWPAVYSRMERNMDRMQVMVQLKPQTADILSYLESASAAR